MSSPLPPAPPSLRVLVVEDNPGDARLVRAYLEEESTTPVECQRADTLAQALASMQAHPADIVLLDLSLPDSYGLETLARLRAAFPSVPVVVLTGTNDEEIALEALRQGAQDYLVKGQGGGELVRRAVRYAIGRSEAEAALRQSETRFRALFMNAGAGVILVDRNGAFLHCNPAFCAMVGRTEAELQALTIGEITHPEDRARVEDLYRKIIDGEIDSYDTTKRYLHRDGSVRWVRLTVTAMSDTADPAVCHAVAVVEDVTETRRLEDHMRLATTVFENTGEGLFVTDANRRIIHVNPAFSVLTGYQPQDVLGRSPRVLSSGRHPPEFYLQMLESLKRTGKWQGEIWNRRKNGEMFAVWLNIAEVHDESGRTTNFVSVFSDITARKEDEERLSYQANHDPLTRLPNRTLFQERLSRALTRATRSRGMVALLFIDLDFFKQVNDTLGHLAGDLLLQQVAERLAACVRQGDTVARLAGDEFTVILEDLTEARDSAVVAHKILSLLAQPFDLAGQRAQISSSIGVALYPADADDAATLVKLADAAMYGAKRQGRNGCRFHSETINAQAFHRLALEGSLRRAVERQEFDLHFQPLFTARGGSVAAVEALLRWQHPDLGTMPPAQFLALAEESGLSEAIGREVLRQACRQAKSWLDLGIAPGRVCVNLSPRQIRSAEIVTVVAQILAETGLPAAMLELDLPEQCVTDRGHNVDALLTRLKALGVKIALDEFGSGYSSFSALRHLPADRLKISRSFILDAVAGHENAEVLTAIVAVARGLHMEVVAAGIETPAHWAAMIRYECELVQGFLFAPPMPAEQMTAFLRHPVPPPLLVAAPTAD